jgi:hypothetical protein
VHDDRRHYCDWPGKVHIGVILIFHGRAIWRVILAMLYSHPPCRLGAGSQVMDSPAHGGQARNL